MGTFQYYVRHGTPTVPGSPTPFPTNSSHSGLLRPPGSRCGAHASRAPGRSRGGRTQIWDCSGAANQTWSQTASHGLTVYLGSSWLCPDASIQGTSPGTKVITWPCNGRATSNGRPRVDPASAPPQRPTLPRIHPLRHRRAGPRPAPATGAKHFARGTLAVCG
ncbi:ricin-type beta-trefoil lectin domain protein [Streptomyces sp. NBC_00252]|uniref:RICIN domain-containing protein n=1 Tax=Streptomyces sp. NBC_00252 TaxID=2975691 RepID=UPI002E29469B|nr:RICIN domain-containing protein [Streptomyces sp. NBC_00252]